MATPGSDLVGRYIVGKKNPTNKTWTVFRVFKVSTQGTEMNLHVDVWRPGFKTKEQAQAYCDERNTEEAADAAEV